MTYEGTMAAAQLGEDGGEKPLDSLCPYPPPICLEEQRSNCRFLGSVSGTRQEDRGVVTRCGFSFKDEE
nr:hypothetical protein CFP56_31364 [Quercus suber]